MTTYINDDIIEKIKDSCDIVDIISDYVQLKKSGTNYVGLCPFHNEKTPSFTVSESKQYFHCFGCGEGGDAISFIMKRENLDFIDAIKFLGDKYNIEIKADKIDDEEIKERERLYEINRQAARYFFNNLSESHKSMDYLKNRRINLQTIRKFGLGYANDNWDSLHEYLVSKGFKSQEIEKIGLIGKKSGNNGYYDKFRDRIIFPIIDTKSRVIGFGGRVMNDSMPKYLNSKDSIIFNKGNHLYGLNLVSKYSDRKKILLVEGYMDVISLFANGVNYAVACLGTALTERQARLLKRFGEEVFICYDSDEAGIKATLRAIEILVKTDIRPRIILLPSGMDPDDYIQKMGKIEFDKLFIKSLNHIDYQINIAKDRFDIETIEGKIEFTLEVARIIKTLNSPVEQDVYIKKISEETGVAFEAIEAEIRKSNSFTKRDYSYKNWKNKDKISPTSINIVSGQIKAELDLLLLMIEDKDYFDIINESLTPNSFSKEEFNKLYDIIIAEYKTENTLNFDKISQIYYNEIGNKEVIELLINHDINYQATKIEEIIDDLINTLLLSKLELEREEIIQNIEKLEKKEDKSDEENKMFLDYCLELTNINNKIKSIKHK
ncbi:MAG: DNA primase [Tissierellaceae bacterium]|jgi:DNA primase|nr:DNA primase [Tissierellia bacterium]